MRSSRRVLPIRAYPYLLDDGLSNVQGKVSTSKCGETNQHTIKIGLQFRGFDFLLLSAIGNFIQSVTHVDDSHIIAEDECGFHVDECAGRGG